MGASTPAASRTRPLSVLVREHRALAVVLAAGLLVRLVLLVASYSTQVQIGDERQYVQLAANLFHGHGFVFEPGRPTSMRPPVYPMFIAAVWSLTGHESLQAIRAVQILLALLTTLAVYVLAFRMFDRRTALIAAAITCFYPSFLFSGLLLLTEVLFTLLLVVFALQYDSLVRRPGLAVALSTGATLGLAALTRSVLWPFPIVLVPLVAMSVGGTVRRRITLAICCLAGYAAIVGPWAVRNTTLQHTLTIVDNMGGMNLMMGNYEHTPEDRMWDAVSLTGEKNWSHDLGNTHPEAATWTDGQKEKWAQSEAIGFMLANPATTIRRSVLKFADFWGLEREMVAGFQQGLYDPPAWFMLMASLAVLLTYPVVILGSAVGIFCVTPSDRRTHVLLIALILFITAIHSIVFGHSRYHLPLVPFLATYAAAAVAHQGWRVPARERMRAIAAGGVCAVLVSAWAHEIFFRDAEHVRAFLRLLT
jgi:4-amino-4-deoxy-L-arabinose transferase-like glycosyltransferase